MLQATVLQLLQLLQSAVLQRGEGRLKQDPPRARVPAACPVRRRRNLRPGRTPRQSAAHSARQGVGGVDSNGGVVCVRRGGGCRCARSAGHALDMLLLLLPPPPPAAVSDAEEKLKRITGSLDLHVTGACQCLYVCTGNASQI